MNKIVKNLIYSQISYLIGLTLCVIIRPLGLGTNAGISYYGTHISTVLPYAVGLLLTAYFMFQAIRYLPITKGTKPVNQMVRLCCILIVLIVLTPYSVSSVFDFIHTASGSLLFICQLVLGAWLVLKVKKDALSIILWLLELTGGIISAFYVLPPNGFLLQSQLLFQVSFGLLIIKSFYASEPKLN